MLKFNRVRKLVAAGIVCQTALTVGFVSSGSADEGAAKEGTQKSSELTPPQIPVGLDAYRQWDKWPVQRIGARAYMRSTYDRKGGNESADSSHYLYQLRDDYNVSLDVEGAGYLYFARYNHWHGSPWHYEVDGVNNIVKETTTADPTKKLKRAVFLPEKPFPSPLTYTYETTKGADLSWVPIGFLDRFRMAYSRTFYGTGYYIYHLYAPGANLSQPIKSWNEQMVPSDDVLNLLRSAGTDIAPKQGEVKELNKTVHLAPGKAVTVAELTGQHSVRAIKLDIPRKNAVDFGLARLRITWDGREYASVDAPIALFFGSGTLHNRENKEYLVKALPVNIRFTDDRVQLACYFPMPFFKSAKIELVGADGKAIDDVKCSVRTTPHNDRLGLVGYFHANYHDHLDARLGHDLVFLDTDKIEGGGPWSGNFVGTSFIFSDKGNLRTLEADPRFFFDDSQTPQAHGTGTEEWGGGGDYWGGLTMTLPLAGHPVGVRRPSDAKVKEDLIESAYRFLLADLMPFGKRALIQMEHGGHNNRMEHYQSVTYWYGAPSATLVLTDSINVGDTASEAEHEFRSPDASKPYTIATRYEWGPDHLVVDAKVESKPEHFAEFEFDADANKTYSIWVRGRSSGEGNLNDATWFQFDDLIGTFLTHEGHGEKGFGNWRDKAGAGEWAWSSHLPGDKPETIRFTKSGKHRLRVQRRHGGHEIETIWLSATQKEEPTADAAPKKSSAAGQDEIVLSANDAKVLSGGVKAVQQDGQTVLSVGPPGGGRERIEVYPEQTVTGRTTTKSSEFTVQLDKDNWGVLLRRTLDYKYPNQRAKVYVADADADQPDWKEAGIWYLAGSNTCYYSYPGRSGKVKYRDKARGELSKTEPQVQTSNRRLRDDEFLVSHELTRGRKAIRVKVEFTPVSIPLLPGMDVAEEAWSEIAYQVYCYVLPEGEGMRD